MNSSAPGLLPIFRTEGQARILSTLLLDPELEVPIAQLTAAAGLSQPSTLREVNRLLEAGILREKRSGNYRLVRANTDSPYFAPLVQILARSYGPLNAVTKRLQQIPGIKHAVFAGSWAARALGIRGGPPRDVDVVIVGDPQGRLVRRATAELESELDLPVHFTVVTASEWDGATSGFVRHVQSSPSIPIELEPTA